MRIQRLDFVGLAIFAALVVVPGRPPLLAADEPASKDQPAAADNAPQAAERKLLREQMTARIAKVKVATVNTPRGDAPERTATLIAKPLMTYTDEPLFINSATLWAWSPRKDGRPIAICKIEHYDVTRRPLPSEWLYCFASVSGELIHADWPDGHQWTARRPGIAFHDVLDAPRPGESSAARQRQMKEFSRRFASTMDFGKTVHEELRLLPQPIYTYGDAEAGIIDGAIFAAAMNGTNPTALFLIELQREQERQLWKFAVAAMTDGGVVVKFDDKEVWSKPALHAPGKDFETWTYFFEQREQE
jgi:hypothetical protein